MATHRMHVTPYKRRLKGRTNYKKRLGLLKSRMIRVVIRKSTKSTRVQFVKYAPSGDMVVCSADSHELKAKGWKYSTGNLPSAYLTGLLAGRKAADAKIKKAVLDIGLHPSVKGARIYSALKGLLDAGIDVPHSEEILPSDERITGKHISEYAASAKQGENASGSQFTLNMKEGADPLKIVSSFSDIKKKIMG